MIRIITCDKPPLKLLGLLLVLPVALNQYVHAQTESLETALVVSREVDHERILEGTVEAVNQATVSAQTSGQIAEVNYDVNDFVSKGSILIRLHETEQSARVAQAEAEVRAARARYQEASKSLKRAEELFNSKNISKAQLDLARADKQAGKAQIEAAQATVKQVQEQLAYTVIRAPYQGIVTRRHVEIGESVSPGQPLMTGFSLESLRVRVEVPQQMIYTVRKLDTARLIHPDPGQTDIVAESITVFPYANEPANTFTVRVNLPANAVNLFPGMLVKVAFVTGKHSSLVIPESAVVHRSEVVGVYVVDQTGTVHLRHIRIGNKTGDGMINVLSGLGEGEQVALDPIRAGIEIKQSSGES